MLFLISEVPLWQADDAPAEAAEVSGKEEVVADEKEKKGERGAGKNVFTRSREK